MNDNTYPLGVPKRAIAEKAAAEKKAKEAAAPKTEFEKYKYTLPTAPVKVAEPVDEYDAWLLSQSLHNEVLEDLGRLIMGGRGGDKSMVAQAAVKTGWPFELVNPDANQLVTVRPAVETAPVKAAEPIDEYDAWLLAQRLHDQYTAARNEAFDDLKHLAAVETAPTQQYPREWKTYNELHAKYAVLMRAIEGIATNPGLTPNPRLAARVALKLVKRMP